jgi:guanyl-specific ribonuclease Sa
MKVRDVRLSIKSKEDLHKEVKEVWKKLERGGPVKRHEGIFFENS